MRDKFWRKWKLWPKNVIFQIFQRLYYLISILEGKPYEEMHEFCDFTLEEQNEVQVAKGVTPRYDFT